MANSIDRIQRVNQPSNEKEMFWSDGRRKQPFKKTYRFRERGAEPFVFYEALQCQWLPGIHHVISEHLKDMVCRYNTMQVLSGA
jgi:isoleucyl-tRNA synthetase